MFSNMCRTLAVSFLLFVNAYTAPINFQGMHALRQKTVESQQILQQQLQQIQRLQGLQQQVQEDLYTQLKIPPVIILLPRQTTKIDEQTRSAASINSSAKEIVNEDLDSITIDAESEQPAVGTQNVVLIPNYARLSIGDVISAIPFLPIEINVPDTIGWAYNGISSGIASIISIFGRLPFSSSPTTPTEEVRLKSALQMIQMKKQNSFAPIILMPIQQIVPIQLPIQV